MKMTKVVIQMWDRRNCINPGFIDFFPFKLIDFYTELKEDGKLCWCYIHMV